ncbi:translation initiation factor IF-2-like [Motacilla alba alba]|uniref:translation initiation factor IF-2-like n=1 Tax=Motacilla alba alba TaxID=1094192 RepID=UPI0018D5236B|nr:translation initiation factor IF-2-like [Motacilla alba alba]
MIHSSKLIVTHCVTYQTQPSLAAPSPGPIRPPSASLHEGRYIPIRLGPGHTHILLSQHEAANIHKAEARGAGEKQGREFVREDVELRHGGGTADRRRQAHTALLRAHSAAAAARPAMGPSQLRRDRPNPPAARPGTELRWPRSPFRQGGRQGPLSLRAAAADAAARSGAARPRHGRPSPAARPPPARPPPPPPPVPGTDLGLSRAAQGDGWKDRAAQEGKRVEGQDRAASQAPAAPKPPRRPPPHARGRRAFIKGPAARGAPPIGCRGGQGGHVTRRLRERAGGGGEGGGGACARTAQGREGAKAALAARAVSAPLPHGVREGGESPRALVEREMGPGPSALECS